MRKIKILLEKQTGIAFEGFKQRLDSSSKAFCNEGCEDFFDISMQKKK